MFLPALHDITYWETLIFVVTAVGITELVHR